MKKEYAKYLKQLRVDGIKSAVGAIRHLEKTFKISNSEAKEIVKEYNWKYSFYD